MEKVKTCARCKKTMPLSKFNKAKSEKYGVKCYCKKCQALYQSEWRKKNQDKVKNYKEKDKKRDKGYVRKRPILFKSDTHKECATCGAIHPRRMFQKVKDYERIHCISCYSKKRRLYHRAYLKKNKNL